MALFEYLAIAFGLLYSVAALRLLGGLPYAIEPQKRYWVHIGMTVSFLLGISASFWTFWSLTDVEWTFPRFLLALTIPGLLYFCAAMIVPDNPADVTSWRDHYYAVHRRLFIGLGLWGVFAATSATLNLGMPLIHPARVVHVASVLVGVVGATSSNPRVHAAMVVALIALWGLTGLTSASQPGWLAG